jgi:hypothetical protein
LRPIWAAKARAKVSQELRLNASAVIRAKMMIRAFFIT